MSKAQPMHMASVEASLNLIEFQVPTSKGKIRLIRCIPIGFTPIEGEHFLYKNSMGELQLVKTGDLDNPKYEPFLVVGLQALAHRGDDKPDSMMGRFRTYKLKGFNLDPYVDTISGSNSITIIIGLRLNQTSRILNHGLGFGMPFNQVWGKRWDDFYPIDILDLVEEGVAATLLADQITR